MSVCTEGTAVIGFFFSHDELMKPFLKKTPAKTRKLKRFDPITGKPKMITETVEEAVCEICIPAFGKVPAITYESYDAFEVREHIADLVNLETFIHGSMFDDSEENGYAYGVDIEDMTLAQIAKTRARLDKAARVFKKLGLKVGTPKALCITCEG